MKSRPRIYSAIIMCLAWVSCAPAAETFKVYWENDGTFIKPNDRTDRHYTDGIKFVYTHQPEWNWLEKFGQWNNFGKSKTRDEDMSAFDTDLPNIKTAVGYFIGQNMYTPDNADNPTRRSEEDRVFAACLYGGIFAQRAFEDKMEHFELDIGMIGPSAFGSEIQTFIHRLVNQEEPNGWDNQIDDEFAVDFTWFARQRADAFTFTHTSNLDSHLEYGFTAGSVHRNAVMSVLFRAGFNLPNDFGPGRLEAPACATCAASDEPLEFYVFTRLGGKLVEFDRFLTGLREKPVVGLAQIGGVVRYKSFEIIYSQTFLTREYDQQPDADSYASLTLSYKF